MPYDTMNDVPDDALLVLYAEDPIARVLMDAEAQQTKASAPRPVAQTGLFTALWPALAGTAMATVIGVWIGNNPPAGLEPRATGDPGGDEDACLVDLLPALAMNSEKGKA